MLAVICTIKNNWSCISGNITYNNTDIYYDELALRLEANNVDIQNIHKDFQKYYGKNQHWISLFRKIKTWLSVDCAFGGICIYKMDELLHLYHKYGSLYSNSSHDYPNYTCEHIFLQKKLQKPVLISPLIKYNNAINFHANIKKEISIMNTSNHQPKAFVPRDAGFFSVFNFLVGSIADNNYVYPLFNKDELLKMHHKNEHFAYWTNNANCWFDYFEPVKYHNDDNTHISGEYLFYQRYSGENCAEEFRIPSKFYNLLKGDKTILEQWRKNIHQKYKKHIVFKKPILDTVETMINKIKKETSNIIGVHYRHPSHFIESGKVYLEDFFSQIDNLLKQYPESKIFLASDSAFGIYSFIEKYSNDRVFYYPDIDRISMAEFLRWSFGLADGSADHVGFINGKGYELHHSRVNNDNNFKLTTDLLVEVLTLSRCNQLVNTVSNIPLAISYMNPEIEIITI